MVDNANVMAENVNNQGEWYDDDLVMGGSPASSPSSSLYRREAGYSMTSVAMAALAGLGLMGGVYLLCCSNSEVDSKKFDDIPMGLAESGGVNPFLGGRKVY
mmetsp:Transcript_23582/g.46081  ORF Transcript_23582/g.46081 Transcript_23582/m.46081 type:complete len:102 (-) Transcript_23582:231-536(-)